MPEKKQRVSVVRISRQVPHQPNLNELQEETEPDPLTIRSKPSELPRLDETPPHKKAQNAIRKEDVQISTKPFQDVSQTKSDVFTLEVPQVSVRFRFLYNSKFEKRIFRIGKVVIEISKMPLHRDLHFQFNSNQLERIHGSNVHPITPFDQN